MYTLQDETNVWRSLFNGDVVEVTMTPALQRHYDVIARQLQVSDEDTQLMEGVPNGTDNNMVSGGSGLSAAGGQGSGSQETYTDSPGGQVLLLCEGKRRPAGVQGTRSPVSVTPEARQDLLRSEAKKLNERLITEMRLRKTK